MDDQSGVVVLLSLCIGLTTENLLALGLVTGFGGWLGIYLTNYSSSSLYPVMSGLIVMFVTLWVLTGDVRRPLVIALFVFAGGFALLALYLFIAEIR